MVMSAGVPGDVSRVPVMLAGFVMSAEFLW